MSKHFSWDYEESKVGYYHIFPVSGEGDVLLDESAIGLTLLRSDVNDFYIRSIVSALDSLASRI